MVGLSVKSQYGIAAMVELAILYDQGAIRISELSNKHNIPQNYLEQLLVDLKNDGLVKSFRGSQGGYVLAKSPEKITINNILNSLEGASKFDMIRSDRCKSMAFFWKEISDKIDDVFDVKLSRLVLDKQRHEKMVIYVI